MNNLFAIFISTVENFSILLMYISVIPLVCVNEKIFNCAQGTSLVHRFAKKVTRFCFNLFT